MAFKIEIVNNALSVTNTISTEIELFQPTSFTWYEEDSLKSGFVKFYGITDQINKDTNKYEYNKVGNSFAGYPVAECIDSTDTPFTDETFRTFTSDNLGKSNGGSTPVTTLDSQIIVTQDNVSTVLGGVIDSTKEYLVDGVIDMSGIETEVPAGGLTIKGVGANISKLICSDDNYTMFKSAAGGSGDFITEGLTITTSGANSKMVDLVSINGTDLFSFTQIIWDNCTEIGVIDSYFQGLESVTTRRFGTPQLTFKGFMFGHLVSSSNTVFLDDASYSLYKGDVSLLIFNRFKSDQTVDLPDNANYTNFSSVNFVNPSGFQLENVSISRNGVFNPNDSNITPNTNCGDISSSWKDCVGICNTHVGGRVVNDTEVTTFVNNADTYYFLEGLWLADSLEHFDSPSNGQLRHIGNTPREYKANCYFKLDSNSNDVLSIRIQKFTFATGLTSTVHEQKTQVNSFIGGRDVGDMYVLTNVNLDFNDYIYIEVANIGDNNNVIAEVDSFVDVSAR